MQPLSVRLKTIADLVPEGSKVCDVGTDHGYLAIYLKLKGIAKNVIATDLNEKPLKRASENIAAAGVSGIELRLCDGLCGLGPNEADTVIIAGMGGEVISGIIERGGNITESSDITFILQPTTSPEFLRRFLCDNCFAIEREVPVLENGKVYSVIVCKKTDKKVKVHPSFYYTGLVTDETPAGKSYVLKQKTRLEGVVNALVNVDNKKNEYEYFKECLEGINSKF